MVKLVSIDSSTNYTGMAFFENGKYVRHILIDQHIYKDVDRRIDEMIRGIAEELQKFKPDIVYIEQPKGSGGNVEMVRKLSEILGAVRLWCVWKGKDYHEIMPSVWRKNLHGFSQGGKSRCELKQEAIDYVKRIIGIDCDTDSADAICIGLSVIDYFKECEEQI